jgi:hypothetical protein
MNYKGFNIAVHEMGHNVEQTFSLNDVDYTAPASVPTQLLPGWPNQGHDLVPMLPHPTPRRKLKNADDFKDCEIARVAGWASGTGCTTIPKPPQATQRRHGPSRRHLNRYYAPIFHKNGSGSRGVTRFL